MNEPVTSSAQVSARFFSRVDKTDTCWLWAGAKTSLGYGVVSVAGRLRPAHRVSWWLHHGRWPAEGMSLLHSCDIRNCVNPSHLREGTARENSRDASMRKAAGGAPGARVRLPPTPGLSRVDVAVGARALAARDAAGLTQPAAAKLLNDAGALGIYDKADLSKLERGLRKWTAQQIRACAEVYGCAAADILGEDDEVEQAGA